MLIARAPQRSSPGWCVDHRLRWRAPGRATRRVRRQAPVRGRLPDRDGAGV